MEATFNKNGRMKIKVFLLFSNVQKSISKKIIKYWVINNDKNDECL